jgi:hypothetical protein
MGLNDSLIGSKDKAFEYHIQIFLSLVFNDTTTGTVLNDKVRVYNKLQKI